MSADRQKEQNVCMNHNGFTGATRDCPTCNPASSDAGSPRVAEAMQAYIGARFRAETESMRQAQGDDNADIVGCARGERDRALLELIAAVRAESLIRRPDDTEGRIRFMTTPPKKTT